MMQLGFFFLKNRHILGYECVSIQNSTWIRLHSTAAWQHVGAHWVSTNAAAERKSIQVQFWIPYCTSRTPPLIFVSYLLQTLRSRPIGLLNERNAVLPRGLRVTDRRYAMCAASEADMQFGLNDTTSQIWCQ